MFRNASGSKHLNTPYIMEHIDHYGTSDQIPSKIFFGDFPELSPLISKNKEKLMNEYIILSKKQELKKYILLGHNFYWKKPWKNGAPGKFGKKNPRTHFKSQKRPRRSRGLF